MIRKTFLQDGTKFMDHVAYITDPISNMDWYEDEAWSIPGQRPNEEIYERELEIIENARKDVIEREKKAISGNQIKAYNDLKVYLDWKKETLKTYFDKPLKDPKIVEQYKKIMKTKAGRFVLRRAIDWMRDKLPGVIVGGVLTMAGMVWGILQIADDMGKNIVSKGKDAVKKLSDKLKEIVKKQSSPLRAILGGVAGILSLGGGGLSFIKEHFWWFVISLTVLIILIIIILVFRRRGGVRVRKDSEDD